MELRGGNSGLWISSQVKEIIKVSIFVCAQLNLFMGSFVLQDDASNEKGGSWATSVETKKIGIFAPDFSFLQLLLSTIASYLFV